MDRQRNRHKEVIMSKFKKLIATVITFAMVFGLVGMMAPATVQAAGATAAVYNAATNEVTVTASSTKYIGVRELNPTNDKVKSDQVFELAAAATSIKIDVTAFAKKDVTLEFYVPGQEDTASVSIKRGPKLKAKVVDLTEANFLDALEISIDGKEIEATDYTKLQYRTTGAWTAITAADSLNTVVASYGQFGGIVYLRVAPVDTAKSEQFSSQEVKVKVAKAGKAPKVTVNYVKDEVKFGKGLEVTGTMVLDSAGAATATKWGSISDKEAVTKQLSELTATDNKLKAHSFYVRTGASLKKPASALAFVDILESKALTGTLATAVAQYDKSETPKLEGVKLENTSTGDLEYCVVVGTGTPGDTTVWNKLSSKSSTLLKDVTSGTSHTIYVRTPGVNESTGKNAVEASRISQPLKVVPSGFSA